MIKQVKFKRLQVNAGFTLSIANGTMAVKISETHYRVLGCKSSAEFSAVRYCQSLGVGVDSRK